MNARRRRRLALLSAPPALVALAVAAKLVSVGFLGNYAADSFGQDQHDDVAQAAEWLSVANVPEPHKALFAAGDGHVLAGDFAAARSDFAAALMAGAGQDECKVRINLLLSIEKLGDAAVTAGNQAAAARFFQEALGVSEASPPQCHEPGSWNAAGEGDRLEAAVSRLKGKMAAEAEGSGSSEQPTQEPSPAPQQEQLEQLDERARQALRERSEGHDRGEYLRGPDKAPGVDRPW
ncbi:hypothetical protein ACFRJ9_05005 [Paenarthrobacter sp. NPDC056912]|uniref:hypothetical protein n=1 Tax=Paenarthrobacter sp. NPDC056912 TaxID=3345965 RepID=UPI00366F5511